MVFAALGVPVTLREASELLCRVLLLCGCPCASHVILTRPKSSATKNAPRTECETLVVSRRLLMRGFLSDELDRFITFILWSYLTEAVSSEVPVLGAASASE